MNTIPTEHQHDFVDVNINGQREIERWLCIHCGAKFIRETRESEPIEVYQFSS